MDEAYPPASGGRRSECPGCGLVLPHVPGPAHPYLGASPACWAVYGQVLAREYGDPAFFRFHQVTVDTYAVQHPGTPGRRSTRSVALHLATLCLVLEDNVDPGRGPTLHRMLARESSYRWLDPPRPIGRLTIAGVRGAADPEDHERRVQAWARDVWEAWTPHHETIRRWVEGALGGRA